MSLSKKFSLRAKAPLAVALVAAAVFCRPSTAAAVEMSLPSVSGEPNDLVELAVSLTTVTNLHGYYFKLSYSTALLEYVGIQTGTLSNWSQQVNSSTPGILSVAAAGSLPVSGSGTAALLQFRIKASASLGQSAAVLFQEAELNDGAIPVSTSDGFVLVGTLVRVTIPPGLSRAPSLTLDVPLEVDDGSGMFGYFFKLSYDPNVFTFDSVQAGTLTSGWNAQSNDLSGMLIVAAGGSTSASGGGTLAILRFQVNSEAPPGSSSLAFAELELNDGALDAVGTGNSVTIIEVPVRWVDFAYTGSELGSFANPFSDLAPAVDGVSVGGLVKFKAGAGGGPIVISKALTLLAPSGPVRIGVGGAKTMASSWPSEPSAKAPASTGSKALSSPDSSGADSIEVEATADPEEGEVYAPVLPYSEDAPGIQRIDIDAPMALRLRGDAPFDLASLWASADIPPETTIEWRAADPAGQGDLWIVFTPNGAWPFGGLLAATVGGTTETGNAIQSQTYTFQVESEGEYANRLESEEPLLWQPGFDDSGEVQLRTIDLATVEPLPNAIGPLFAIGPEQVFDTPPRVWLPVPEGAEPETLRLHVYIAGGPNQGWHEAKDAANWLVPDSELHLDMGGERYIGYLVKHGAITQLAVP